MTTLNSTRLAQQLATPWERRSRLYSLPGALVVKMRAGEAPSAIPTALDVREGARRPATAFGHSDVDRTIHRLAESTAIARVHASAAQVHRSGHRNESYDDVEHALGLSRTFRLRVPASCCIHHLVDALRHLAVVEDAHPQYVTATPFAASLAGPGQTGIEQIDGEAAWESRMLLRATEALAYEPGDPAVIVAVVDTGVAQAHPELQERLRSGVDTVQVLSDDFATGVEIVGDRRGFDTDPEDVVGHGTACAGIIGARGTDRLPPGLAGEARLLPVRVLGAARFPGRRDLIGVGALSDIDEGVKRAVDLGAKVINMSFGTPETQLAAHDTLPHADVVRYGLARGCVMIAASGNSGERERYAPASLDGVIAVGASGSDRRPAAFSTRGTHLDVAAPGVRVVSTGLDGYARVTGTSFAAPFVAAAAGLLVSRAARRSHALDSRAVRDLLVASAQPWADGVDAREHGVGLLDAAAALTLLDAQLDAGSDRPSDLTEPSRPNRAHATARVPASA